MVTGSVFVPVYLSAPAAAPVVVSYWTVDGTATAGSDYIRWGSPSNPRTVTIPTGAVQTQVNVPVLTDDDTEGDETFSVVATATGGDVVVGDDTGTATIVDADALSAGNPVITVSNPTVVEGDQGERVAQFLIHLSRPPVTNVTITYSTADGTAVAGVDYRAKLPGTVVFAPGQISKTVDVAILSNTTADGARDLSLEVALTGGSPLEELNLVGVATIVDDDIAAVQCAPGTFNATDGNEPCTPAPPGFFVDTAGALSATPCPLGRFQDQAGQTECLLAAPGTFVDTEGQTQATACAPGSYQPGSGQTECLLAPIGEYVESSGSTTATACPVNTTTTAPGATSPDDCVAVTPPPVIDAFSAVTPSGAAPVTTALTWTISDPGATPLSCQLDLDDDATYDMSISDCTSASLRTATFTDVGANTVTLMVSNGSSSATATTTVTVGAASTDVFDITLRLHPAFSPADACALDAAATRWENVITAGLPAQATTVNAGTFFPGVPSLNTTVDDVFIDVTVEAIDGPGGAVALGGGGRFRPDGTAVWGAVAIDTADLATLLANPPAFLDTVTHEMGHVLLGGSAFTLLRDDTNPSDPRFIGAAANGIYQELGGTGTIPMNGGSHWSETAFGTELMTPSFTIGVPSQLSAMTAAALADMNYGVDLAGAEPYSLPMPMPPAMRAAPTTLLQR